MYDCIIIGGGIAGLTAAIYTARAGLRTLVIEKLQCGGQLLYAHKAENYPGFIGRGAELADKTERQAIECGAEIIRDNVISLCFDGNIKKLICSQNNYRCRYLIAACGMQHRQAGFVGEREFTGRGVSYCSVCDGALYKDKNTAVIGGANSAVSEALYLSDICSKVYVLYRGERLRAERILLKRLLKKPNIEVHYNTVPVCVKGSGTVEQIITNNGLFPVKCVFVAVGFQPQTEIFKNILSLTDGGEIITNDKLETNIKGIFAAGDCREKQLRQIVTAAADGALAAAGVIDLYKKHC